MIKNIIKMAVFISVIFVVTAFVSYIYIYRNSDVSKKIENNGSVSFSVLLYGTENMLPDKLNAYMVLYDKKTNTLRVLNINTDTVVFKKREKARSLKTRFQENSKKDLHNAVKNFYLDLHEVMNNTVESDFDIHTSFEKLNTIFGHNNKLNLMLLKDNFANKDLESLNHLETAEHILHLLPCTMPSLIIKNYDLLETNISKISFIVSVLRFKISKPVLMFCELPVKYTNTRVEPDKQNIEEFFNKIYYVNVGQQSNSKDILIDIKNASTRPRMAEKAAWLLRENKFDVLDWATYPLVYNVTLIKDYKGNFEQSLRIAEVLKAGKVIVSCNKKLYSDITLFVGKDCVLYDNLDKKGERNVKN
jgi:hypothetical protein